MVDRPAPPTDEPEDRLLQSLLEQREADVGFDIESFLAQHPTHAPALRLRFCKLAKAGLLADGVPLPLLGAAIDVDLPIGAVITGRYRVLELLGKGAMGAVFLAQDQALRCDVALKVMRLDPASARGGCSVAVERFRAEAQFIAQLDHPGIVPIHDLGTMPDGRVFYTMRHVAGRTLQEWIDATQQLQLERCVEVLERICDVLRFAHERGVVHRDLKPSNVMVGSHGEVYVMDWGLARSVGAAHDGASIAITGRQYPTAREESDSPTQTGDVLGTLAYMAPEQARGDHASVGPAADVFGLGAIMHHLLLGHPPIAPGTREAVKERVAEGAVAIAPRPRCVPRELYRVCRKALAADIQARHGSADEMKAALQAYRDATPTQTDGLLARWLKWVRRHPVTATATAATLVIVLLATLANALRVQLEGERLARLALAFDEQIRDAVPTPTEDASSPAGPDYASAIRAIVAAYAAAGMALDGSLSAVDVAAAWRHAARIDPTFGDRLRQGLLNLDFYLELGQFGVLHRLGTGTRPAWPWLNTMAGYHAALAADHADLVLLWSRVDATLARLPLAPWDQQFRDLLRFAFGPRKGIVERFRALLPPPDQDGTVRAAEFAASFTSPLKDEAVPLIDAALQAPAGLTFRGYFVAVTIENRTRKDPDRLLRYAAAALRLAPRNPAAWMNYGVCLLIAGRIEAAEQMFLRTLDLAPDSLKAWFNLAVTHERQDDIRTTVRCLDEVLQRAPDHVPALGMRMVNRLRLGDIDGAEADYRQFRDSGGALPTPWRLLAVEFAKRGMHERAVAILEELVIAHPDDGEALGALGEAHRTH